MSAFLSGVTSVHPARPQKLGRMSKNGAIAGNGIMANKKFNGTTAPAGNLDQTLIRIITQVVMSNGAAELVENYGFTHEQATSWATATAKRATAQMAGVKGPK